MSAMPTQDQPPVLTITDAARTHVQEIRGQEPDSDTLALWLEVNGEAHGDFTYDMYFEALETAADGDLVQHHDDLAVVIPADSVDRLRGAELGLSRDLLNPGMVITNPNRPSAPSAGAGADGAPRPQGDLSGEVAQRVLQVLDSQINPGIAAHGGHAELVAVEEEVAYLRLSGGCQGCGLAAVTLSQGIEVAIRDAVPEITSVVDVTDHSSGANPYYEAAKK